MGQKKSILGLVGVVLLSLLVACGSSPELGSSTDKPSPTDGQVTNPVADQGAGPSAAAEPSAVGGETSQGITAESAAEAVAENHAAHGDAADYVWDNSQAVSIQLDGNSIAVEGGGVAVDGSRATITSAGTYRLSGSLADGQIVVDTQDEEIVRLVLDGVEIHNASSAAIYVANAEETVIILADGTDNFLSDGESYTFADAEEDEPNATLFSKDDLTLYGDGSLTVEGNYNDGIGSKDGLVIRGGTITVNAVDDGIRGKDYLVVQDGTIEVTAGGDGFKSDNDQDAAEGYISIESGVIHITSGGDAIQAETDVAITAGEFVLSSGGGSNSRIDADLSAKGIKAGVGLIIDGGTFAINSADDAIHSNGSLMINDGTFIISTGDDALHADSTLDINGGQISITDSFEGLESAVITINAGEIRINSSDDGINVAGGNDGSGGMPGAWPGGGQPPGGRPGHGGGFAPGGGGGIAPGGGPGQDGFAYTGDYYLYINGGYVVIDANGDGIDSNGAIEMTDGVVIVNGPTERMNGALDYMASFNISGGFLVAAGSVGMAEAPSESSSQYSVLLNFNTTLRAGTLIHIETGTGSQVLTFSPSKQYQSIAFSSPELAEGTTYDVYYGGSATGPANDNLYQEGTYSPGTQYTSFTLSGMTTRLGSFR